MDKIKAVVGIDPGKTTGVAVKALDSPAGTWVDITSMELWQAFDYCRELSQRYECFFFIEDARLRQWFGKAEQLIYRKFEGNIPLTKQEKSIYKGMLQGSGDVRGACRNWEEFLGGNEFTFRMLPPKKGATKIDANLFKRLTGWKGRTNKHSRDAAMIVQGITRAGLPAMLK